MSEYQLKYHLAGLLEALELPDTTYLHVAIIPEASVDFDLDAYVEETGASVRVNYTTAGSVLRQFKVATVEYRESGLSNVTVTLHGPTSYTKLDEKED